MSAVSELIVREYFEGLGYQVQQPCKYLGRTRQTSGRGGRSLNPPSRRRRNTDSEHVLWTNEDLRTIGQAVVCVYGWHGERIYPPCWKIYRNRALCRAGIPACRSSRRGSDQAANILCLPKAGLPLLKQQLLSRLREKGVHGVLLFRNILRTLIHQVDASRNYDKSDVLQVIRILKIYDLLPICAVGIIQRTLGPAAQ